MTASRKVTWFISSLIMLIIATAAAQPSHARAITSPFTDLQSTLPR